MPVPVPLYLQLIAEYIQTYPKNNQLINKIDNEKKNYHSNDGSSFHKSHLDALSIAITDNENINIENIESNKEKRFKIVSSTVCLLNLTFDYLTVL